MLMFVIGPGSCLAKAAVSSKLGKYLASGEATPVGLDASTLWYLDRIQLTTQPSQYSVKAMDHKSLVRIYDTNGSWYGAAYTMRWQGDGFETTVGATYNGHVVIVEVEYPPEALTLHVYYSDGERVQPLNQFGGVLRKTLDLKVKKYDLSTRDRITADQGRSHQQSVP